MVGGVGSLLRGPGNSKTLSWKPANANFLVSVHPKVEINCRECASWSDNNLKKEHSQRKKPSSFTGMPE